MLRWPPPRWVQRQGARMRSKSTVAAAVPASTAALQPLQADSRQTASLQQGRFGELAGVRFSGLLTTPVPPLPLPPLLLLLPLLTLLFSLCAPAADGASAGAQAAARL